MEVNARTRLRSYRESAGLTVGALAARLGCTPQQVRNIEHGRRKPGLRLALAIERETAAWPQGQVRCEEWDALTTTEAA